MKLSYCITVKDEHEELDRLLQFLKENIKRTDELIIQIDKSGYTNEVLEICHKYTNSNHSGKLEDEAISNSKFIFFPLNGDFSSFKNNLSNHVTGDYIMQLDADEIPTKFLIENIHQVLEVNNGVDVILVPRANYVKGITKRHLDMWGWVQDSEGRINPWDYQWRIYRNCEQIKFINKVHERLSGFRSYSTLPAQEEWSLIHRKDIKKQERQNQFYTTL